MPVDEAEGMPSRSALTSQMLIGGIGRFRSPMR